MDIYKNKASEKFFIHVDDVDHGRAFFITPQGALKPLNLNLFDYQVPDHRRTAGKREARQ